MRIRLNKEWRRGGWMAIPAIVGGIGKAVAATAGKGGMAAMAGKTAGGGAGGILPAVASKAVQQSAPASGMQQGATAAATEQALGGQAAGPGGGMAVQQAGNALQDQGGFFAGLNPMNMLQNYTQARLPGFGDMFQGMKTGGLGGEGQFGAGLSQLMSSQLAQNEKPGTSPPGLPQAQFMSWLMGSQ